MPHRSWLTPDDLAPLEDTAAPAPPGLRQRLKTYERTRSVALGPSMRLQFEDVFTVHSRTLEATRAPHRGRQARPAEGQGLAERRARARASLQPLLPDGLGWRATLHIEPVATAGPATPAEPTPPPTSRVLTCSKLLHEAAREIYLDVPRQPRLIARFLWQAPRLATSGRPEEPPLALLSFDLDADLRAALLAGAPAALGCAHLQYAWRRQLPPATLALLRRDLLPPGVTPT